MSNVNSVTSIENGNNYNISAGRRNNGKDTFSSYLTEEKKSLDDIFESAAKKYNVPATLLKAIGKAESDYNVNAVSRCGAQGVMQLMPATAASLGVTDAFDAEQNIMGGANYISQMLKKYDGDTKLALAAYNAGSNNVAKYGGIPPFEETRNYVKKVMGYINQGVSSGNIMASVKAPIQVTGKIYPSPVYTNFINMPSSTVADTDPIQKELDEFFSYDDYVKLLDLFFEDDSITGIKDNTDEERYL